MRIAVPKQYQAQLFQPYFQIPNHSLTREEGTGLGLAVTRKLVEIHGDSIEVTSEIDRGSKFTVILPRNQVSELEEIQTHRRENITGGASQLCILAVLRGTQTLGLLLLWIILLQN